MTKHVIALIFGLAATLGSPQKARAYDIDCAIMLCMAGGFPPSAVCARAYRTMIRRITPWPVRPPFGVCTFAAIPVELGGLGGDTELDTSLPEFDWLNKTRVIWWNLQREGEREGGPWFNWSIRSCDGENKYCKTIERVSRSQNPPTGRFTSENGQLIMRPSFRSRGVILEFGDYKGNMNSSEWFFY